MAYRTVTERSDPSSTTGAEEDIADQTRPILGESYLINFASDLLLSYLGEEIQEAPAFEPARTPCGLEAFASRQPTLFFLSVLQTLGR